MWFRVVVVACALLWTTTGASASNEVAVTVPDGAVLDSLGRLTPEVDRLRHITSVQPRPHPTPPPEPPGPPSAPWGLVAYPTEEGVLLEWQAPLWGEPDAYRVYRSVDGGAFDLLAQVTDTEYLDEDVPRSEEHLFRYQVTAVYGSQESDPSNPGVFLTGPLSCWVANVDLIGQQDVQVNQHYPECVLDTRS